MKPKRTSQQWLLAFNLSLIGFAGMMFLRGSQVPAISLLATALGFLTWQAALYLRDRRNDDAFEIIPNIQRPHYYQIFFQGSVYLYWSIYWDEVRVWAPLILAQIAFSYALEALLSWSRRRNWRLGFGPWPIVGSINLFFWFKEDYFFLQLLLIAGTQVSKEFITWQRDGRRVHIFNPSAIVLAITGLGIMLTGRIDTAVGADLINSFNIAPNFFEVLLFVGLTVQFFFSTTLVTFGAALSLSIIFFSLKSVGLAPQTPFDTSVLIGLTLLVTDPQTSPKNRIGKFLFGLCYGAGIFASYAILRYVQQPSFFDKIMPVVVVNLLVKQFDGVGNWIFGRMSGMQGMIHVLGNRFLHMGAYAVLFVIVLPSLKVRDPEFVDPFPDQLLRPSPPVQESLAIAIAVDKKYPDVRKPFGFVAEIAHFNYRVELNQDIARSHLSIAIVLHDVLGENDLAMKRLERAAELDPQYTPALNQAKASMSR